jgi:aromatic-L-amino-acid/L-tryptophan decarboxylase
MPAEEFRRYGHMLIDWIADYHEHVESLPVRSRVAPGEVRAQLPEHPPEHGEPFEDMLGDLQEIILPGLTHWQHPNFFAYFPSNNSGPSILGELASAGLAPQGMLWETSPACTELETLVMDWLGELIGLPERFHSSGDGGGVIQDSASSAAICALMAARERATGGSHTAAGIDRELIAYGTSESHSSIEKAVRITGLGTDNYRRVDVDENFAMRADALEKAIAADREAGATPCCVFATVGTTSSTAIDSLREIGEVCRREGVWLHVDAAMSGVAAIVPEHRWIHDGIEYVDSYCTNPHKWLLTNFDCDAFWVADREALNKALTVTPEYLRNKTRESGAAIDYADWEIPLGRRFRALKLWFVLRHYGAEGLREFIRNHIALAREFSTWVDEHPDFELAAPVPQNLVCFRHKGGDEFNMRLREALNDSGRLYLIHTKLDGKVTLRFVVGQQKTMRRHVEEAWERIVATAAELE